MPNFGSLAGLEVADKFVVGRWGGFQVATMSNLYPSYLKLHCVELS